MKRIIIISITCVSVLSFFYFWTISVFIMEQEKGIIFLRRVKPGDTFMLGYLHSVVRSDVWEKFIINNEYQIVLIQTMYQGQGAGLPSTLAENEKLTREGPWFKITGMRRIVPVINWRVDSQWQSRFRFGQEEIISITNLTGDGLVHMKISQIKLIDWLKYKFKKSLPKEIKQT